MKLVLLTHPSTLGSASQPRFASLIQRGMVARGHEVEIWSSSAKLGCLPIRSAFVRKWLGYADQFLIYPRELRQRINQQSDDTLFVVTDQALGMWVPYLVHRPHVIHCHDFLALRSALGEFPENPTGWTGRQYQRLIRKGFSQGQAFISVSKKTRDDLHRFLPARPVFSEVVHNGLNYPFRPMTLAERISSLEKTGIELTKAGFILHVGGNQWYKNRAGVLEIYRAYVAHSLQPPALWMVGPPPIEPLSKLAGSIAGSGKVHFLSGLTDEQVNAAYAHARALLFPSLEEGFGWPIVEAMAAGCPVITTHLAPMTEVAGTATRLIPRMPATLPDRNQWATTAAAALEELLQLNDADRAELIRHGHHNATRFDAELALDAYERLYQQAIQR